MEYCVYFRKVCLDQSISVHNFISHTCVVLHPSLLFFSVSHVLFLHIRHLCLSLTIVLLGAFVGVGVCKYFY